MNVIKFLTRHVDTILLWWCLGAWIILAILPLVLKG